MELEIVSRKDNPLLERIELEVVAHHIGEPTPTRDEVSEGVATAVKAKRAHVLVDHLETTFGKGITRGYVKVYSNKEAALAIEREHQRQRNLGSGKKAEEEPDEGPGEKAGEKPDEGPDEEPGKKAEEETDEKPDGGSDGKAEAPTEGSPSEEEGE